ncbi:AAA family ATPase [Thaumasiovibrio sp. DFM-14]|uniref:AAA family ATPase n=1 Tax=Thaumasiovibrio sp. DFM-14 TaxID=3384792 RepID=UPI0039A016E2
MKAVVAPVKNVSSTQIAFSALVKRSYGVPGIGLLHGTTGLGKTTTTTYLYNQLNGIYVSARAEDTTASITSRIVEELGSSPRRGINKNIDYIIEQMSMHERPLFIDEADYLMNDVRTLETIRDIYDGTEVPVILVGMDQIARRISTRKQFYNRISEWVEFQPADLEDVQIMAEHLLDDGICVSDELLDHLRHQSCGEMRRITIGLNKIETLAKANELEIVTLADWGEQVFHGLRAPTV